MTLDPPNETITLGNDGFNPSCNHFIMEVPVPFPLVWTSYDFICVTTSLIVFMRGGPLRLSDGLSGQNEHMSHKCEHADPIPEHMCAPYMIDYTHSISSPLRRAYPYQASPTEITSARSATYAIL